MNQESTCDLHDRYPDQAQVAAAMFSDFGGRRRFSGEAVTVKCHEDNSRLKELANSSGHGKVMVVDGGGSLRCALLGDMIGKSAAEQGWEGFVIYGCVRDRAELATLDMGVKALGTTPRKPSQLGEGQVGLALNFASLSCRAGDHVFADEDGVLVLPKGVYGS